MGEGRRGRSPAARRRRAAVRPFAGSSPSSTSTATARSCAELAAVFPPGRPIVEARPALCQLIHSTFDFDPPFTDVSTPLSVVLDGAAGRVPGLRPRRGRACARSGLAARYVSGYIGTDPPRSAAGADAPMPGARCGCRARLDRLRPHQRPPAGRPPRDRRVGPRLRRRHAGPRRRHRPAARQTLEVSVDVRRPDHECFERPSGAVAAPPACLAELDGRCTVADAASAPSRPRPPPLVTREFVAVTVATGAFFVYVGMLVPLLPPSSRTSWAAASSASG